MFNSNPLHHMRLFFHSIRASKRLLRHGLYALVGVVVVVAFVVVVIVVSVWHERAI